MLMCRKNHCLYKQYRPQTICTFRLLILFGPAKKQVKKLDCLKNTPCVPSKHNLLFDNSHVHNRRERRRCQI